MGTNSRPFDSSLIVLCFDWTVCVTWCEYGALIGQFVSRGANNALWLDTHRVQDTFSVFLAQHVQRSQSLFCNVHTLYTLQLIIVIN